MSKDKELVLTENEDSINRPSWTQDDLHAYKHKHKKKIIIRNYYVKTHGLM